MTANNLSEKDKEEFIKRIPQKRFAKPSEIADLAYFMGSDQNTYITGQEIYVDGGFSIDELLVKASDRSYNLKFFNNFDKLVHEVKVFEKNTFFIIDKKFNDLNHFDTYLQQDNTLLINSSEKIKTLEFAKDLILQLKERGINRYSTIITVGGGTLQDVSQFVASILYRGVDFVFIPQLFKQ